MEPILTFFFGTRSGFYVLCASVGIVVAVLALWTRGGVTRWRMAATTVGLGYWGLWTVWMIHAFAEQWGLVWCAKLIMYSAVVGCLLSVVLVAVHAIVRRFVLRPQV